LFDKVFGKNGLSFDHMAKAIGAFERTLLTPDAPFDLYVQGKGDISKAAKRGMLKVAEVGCTSCHTGRLCPGLERVGNKKAPQNICGAFSG